MRINRMFNAVDIHISDA
ncbi:hypothetical protein [Cronobacter sakazakii]